MKPVRLRFDTGHAGVRASLLGREGGGARYAAVSLVMLAVAGLFATGWQMAATRQELAVAQTELQALGRRQPAPAAPSRPVLPPEERRAWNQVVRQLNTPWSSLLAALESVTPEDVALVSIEPDARQASVRVQAEAKSLDALLVYAQALKGAEPFADVAPVKHETNEQDPNRPVRLTLNLRLRESRALDAPGGDAR
jgi:Tfp pilus assembly protein PilN